MIQNIYTSFDTEFKKKKKKKQKTKKENTLLFVKLAICSKTFVKLPQRRPYTTSTITVAI
jgi:hypothetical protein